MCTKSMCTKIFYFWIFKTWWILTSEAPHTFQSLTGPWNANINMQHLLSSKNRKLINIATQRLQKEKKIPGENNGQPFV